MGEGGISHEGPNAQPREYPLPTGMRKDKLLRPAEQALLQRQWILFNQLKEATPTVNPLEQRKKEGNQF